jgi:predicted NBD/HSP70 family sugar kinase
MNFSQPKTARTINRLRVLNLLSQAGAHSRAEIARSLCLNKPSTSEIVEQLLEQQIIEETGKAVTTTGRRPTGLSLKIDCSFVLGVEMGSRNTTFILSDLAGNALRLERIPNQANQEARQLGQMIIKTCMKMKSFAPNAIVGITIASSGRISKDERSIIDHDYFNWKNIPLAQAVEAHTQIPTMLVDSVRAMVEAERWFAQEQTPSFIYVNWAEHINSAWVNETTITSQGSKFGHLPIAPTGLCRCQSIGCLETVASGWALREKHQGLSVKQLAQSEEPMIKASLCKAAEAMGIALVAASAVTGCEKIIIGGGLSNLGNEYFDIIRSFYCQQAHISLRKVPIERSKLKEQSSYLGSIAVALDRWVFQRTLLQTMSQLDK